MLLKEKLIYLHYCEFVFTFLNVSGEENGKHFMRFFCGMIVE